MRLKRRPKNPKKRKKSINFDKIAPERCPGFEKIHSAFCGDEISINL
jgi:hypothetical protein